MKIRLNSLTEGQQNIEVRLSQEELEIDDPNFQSKIVVELSIDKEISGIHIKGRVHTKALFACDRCLSDYDLKLDTDFEVMLSYLAQESAETDDSIIPINEKTMEVDISQQILDALLLAIPMKKICRKDCKGLCDVCGANLNLETCSCHIPRPDSRWEPLKQFLNNATED